VKGAKLTAAPAPEAPAGVLDPVRHARLIECKDEFCERANIPVKMLNTSAKPYLGEKALAWIKGYPTTGNLLFTGYHKPGPETQMMALAAVLLRNFVDARVLALSNLIDQDYDPPECTVLLIPNLFVKGPGKGLATWQVQKLYDALLTRHTRGKTTVAYVEDMQIMGDQYGTLFRQHMGEWTHIAGSADLGFSK
jgi:hypothetical protein